MNIFILWFISGLLYFDLAYGTEKYEKRGRYHHHAARSLAEEATTENVLLNSNLLDFDGLNLIFNSEKNVLGFSNTTEDIAFVFRACQGPSVKLLIDARSGTVLRFENLDKIKLTQSQELTGKIKDVLKNVLEKYEYENETLPGESSDIEATSEEGIELWNKIYLHLGHPKEKGDSKYRSLAFLEKFVEKLRKVYFGSLDGLLDGKADLKLKQNLNRFLTITIGLNKLFTGAQGGLKKILSKKIKFDPNSLYNSKNGAEVLVYILRQTGSKFDLGVIWGSLLNDVHEVVNIIQLLGGGEKRNGVDETFAVIGNVWDALTFRLSLASLMSFLTEASSADTWSKSDSGDFKQVVNDLKNITDEQSRKYDSSGMLAPFTKFSTNLTANTLIKNGVNISDLVVKWHKRDYIGGLKFILDATFLWSSFKPYNDLLFDSYVSFLNSSSDPLALKRLTPAVSLEQFSGKEGSLWKKLCSNYNLDEKLKNRGRANEIMNGIPGFSEFSKTYKDYYGKFFNFDKMLKGNSMSEYFKKIAIEKFQWTSNILHDSFSFTKHAFVDPIKLFIPGSAIKDSKIPFLPISPEENKVECKEDDNECATKKPIVAKKSCDDDVPECESSTPKKELTTICEDCEKKETPAVGKIFTLFPLPLEKESEATTKKKCDDCENVVTTKKVCADCDEKHGTEAAATKIVDSFESRNQHHHVKHHSKHHGSRTHHESKHDHEVKHHSRVHHETKKNHDKRKHGAREEKNHSQRHHKLETKHQKKREEKLKDSHHVKSHHKHGDTHNLHE
ncbi:hypothetical protein HHI36_010484 [Cryptolaemus montrouzieri]|uniref:Uncharacterized protein n=1 Tax=Cryptolaemus montrouzieri TaxID=559131 RepID=A0ABD2MJ23_9CUCU